MQPWKEFSTKQSFWAGCLLTAACFLVETSSGAEPTAPDARLLTLAIAMLIAVLCSALTEAVSTPAGILALSAYCAAALFVPAALAFVPLALYDCARCIHRADVLRFSGALALIAIVACLMCATMPPLSTASLLCSRPRPAFSRFARAQRSPASASPGARGTHWPPRRFHFARGIATFETRSIGCRR